MNDTLTKCWFNVGPPSTTLAQHWTNIGSVYYVLCWYHVHLKLSGVKCLDSNIRESDYLKFANLCMRKPMKWQSILDAARATAHYNYLIHWWGYIWVFSNRISRCLVDGDLIRNISELNGLSGAPLWGVKWISFMGWMSKWNARTGTPANFRKEMSSWLSSSWAGIAGTIISASCIRPICGNVGKVIRFGVVWIHFMWITFLSITVIITLRALRRTILIFLLAEQITVIVNECLNMKMCKYLVSTWINITPLTTEARFYVLNAIAFST